MDRAYPNFRPELQLRPGRYRIISELAGTAIQVSEHDHNKVVTWEKHEGENQQWFVQKSGSGYRFKDCQHGHYLAVPSTDNHALVYASRFPTTWVLLKSGDCHIIQYPGSKQVFDLHYGWKTNGNEIHLWHTGGDNNTTWRLECIGDDTGEELPEPFLKEIDRLKQDLVEMRKDMTQKDRMLAEQAELLSRQESTILQLGQDLKSKSEELFQVRQGNEETIQLRKQQAELKDELLQQQAGAASLQGKMDRMEHFMAQMMKRDEERLANVP
ncbi:hypothetical protein BDV93DRAFT_519873 [Ceratobasidium sp. AG-I]|nr:hypothetical protein BDV93DRAFT_519873 [Ceratobasidium sp. AG-I]